MAKVSLKELLERKEKLLNKKEKTGNVFVKSLEGTIKIKAPTASLAKTAQEMDDGDAYLVYQCVIDPNLKDTNLQKEFECDEPIEIVEKIFDVGEIPQIAVEILKLAGYVDGVKLVDDIKN